MNSVYVVYTVDREIVGAAEDKETAKNLARDHLASLDFLDVLEFVEQDSDDIEVTFSWSVYKGSIHIEKVDFFKKGTLFPVDIGGTEPITIPDFLQAE